MKIKFILSFFIFFLSFELFAANDDLSGKGLYCEDKDLVVYLEFNSRSDVDVHFLERYLELDPYRTEQTYGPKFYRFGFPKYKYSIVETKYAPYESRRIESPHQINIDPSDDYERYRHSGSWMHVIRDTLELNWGNLPQFGRNINYVGEGAGRRYREYYGYNIGMTPIFCKVEKKNAAEVKKYILGRAKFLNDRIVNDIIELRDELDRQEEEAKSKNKI